MTEKKNGSRPVGRPRADGRPPVQKEDILRAASQLFAKQGYAGTSVRMIASALKIHPASVFHHFPAKEMIVQSIVETIISRTFGIYNEIRALPLSPAATLYETIWIDSFVTRDNAAELSSTFFIPEKQSGTLANIRNSTEMIIDHYTGLIDAGIKSGDFIDADSRTVADAIYSACESIVTHSLDRQAPPDVQATNIASLFVRGILRDPKRLPKIQEEAASFNISSLRTKLLE